MARITPAGFQTHIQNPLAAVMYAIMNGAMDNARDARRTDYELGRDRQAQDNTDLSRALQVIASGGRIDRQLYADSPRSYDLISAAQGAASGRDQQHAAADAQAAELRDAEIRRVRASAARQEADAAWNSPAMRTVRGVGQGVVDLGSALADVFTQAPKRSGWQPMRGPNGESLLLDRATGRTVPVVPGQTPAPPVQLPPPATIPRASAGEATPSGWQSGTATPTLPGQDMPQNADAQSGSPILQALREQAGIDETGSFAQLLPAIAGPDPTRRAAALRAMPPTWRLRAIAALRAAGVED